MKIFVITALSFVLLGVGLWFYPRTPEDPNILKIGMMSGWAPFMTVNKKGEFEGFDVDVALELAKRLGKKSMISDLGALSSLFVALDRRKIDIILSGLDITQERLKKINMTSYLGNNTQEYVLLFYKNIPENISCLEDLRNYPNAEIVVEPGVSTEKYLASFNYINKKSLASLVDRVLDLQYGKSLAMLVEPQIAKQLMAKNSELKSLLVPLPPEFQIYGMGIATNKQNRELADQVEAAISAMKNDGTLKKLEQKWQLDEQNNEA
jgi:arginine transport system substrate-binding protein